MITFFTNKYTLSIKLYITLNERDITWTTGIKRAHTHTYVHKDNLKEKLCKKNRDRGNCKACEMQNAPEGA